MTSTPETIVQTIENGIYGKPKLEIASNVKALQYRQYQQSPNSALWTLGDRLQGNFAHTSAFIMCPVNLHYRCIKSPSFGQHSRRI